MKRRPALSPDRSTHSSGRAKFVPIVLVLACLFAACGAAAKSSGSTTSDGPSSTSQSDGGNSTSSTRATVPTTTTTYYKQGKVIPKPTTPTTLPRETKGQAVPEYTGPGQQILIYPTAIWPKYLYANDKVAITWTNLTNTTQTITFFHIPFSSLPIPPGGQFIWKSPSGGVIGYRDSSGAQALLNLQAPTPIVAP
jgi:hypothetical protein